MIGAVSSRFPAHSESCPRTSTAPRTLFLAPEASNEETPKDRLKCNERRAKSASPAVRHEKLQHRTLSFDGFTLDLTRGGLLRGTEEVKLRPKSFEVLKYLVENSGRLLSKEELIGAVWPDTAVTDDSLVQCLIEVRRALDDSLQRLVKTVPRRGYIFEGEVKAYDLEGREVVYTEELEGVHVAFEEVGLEGEKTGRAKSPALSVPSPRPRNALWAVALALTCAAVALAAITLFLYRHHTDPGEIGSRRFVPSRCCRWKIFRAIRRRSTSPMG